MLRITVLGTPAVVDTATGQIRNASSRSLALLGLLVAHTGHPQSRAAIAGLFWPDSGDAQALTNLRRELHQLRSVLDDDDSLEVTGTHLCWHELGHHRIDLAIFLREASAALDAAGDPAADEAVVAHGTAALEQCTGPFLDGMDAEWIDELRTELARQCLVVCNAVDRAASRAGRYDVAMAAVRRRLGLQTYDEAGHRRLMELQAASGDRAAAITTYHQLAGLLERDLGLDPDPQTSELFARLLGSPTPTRPSSDSPAGAPSRAQLIGRVDELETALAAWRSASKGRAAVLAVHGGPGIGKTRLVAELQAEAHREGAVVAFSRCFDTDGRLSLAPVADWLRERELMKARTGLDEVWRNEAERLVPSVDPSVAAPPSLPDARFGWQRHRFFEGLAHALLVTSRPVLLVLDNVQWSDPDTLSFVRFLLNMAPDAPLLLAVTGRPATADEAAPSADWLDRLRDEGLLTEVVLSPLDAERTAALAEALTGHRPDGEGASLLHDATGGFPLYVVEATRSSVRLELSADGTGARSGFSSILAKRLRQTSPAAREVAGLAAAVGRDFTIQLLAEASDLNPEAVVSGVDELWRQRIVTDLGSAYDFTHDLLREAAYELVPPTRRWLLHRRLAQALELMWTDHTDAVAAQIADQYRRAGNAEKAVRYFRRAAEVAESVFAHEEAIALLGSARSVLLTLPSSRDRDEQELALLEMGIPPITAQFSYVSPRLREASARILELSEGLGMPTKAIDALIGLCFTRTVAGQVRQGLEIAEQILARVRPGDERYAQALFALAASAFHTGDPVTADEQFRIAMDSMGEEPLTFGTQARVHTMGYWAHTAWTLGDTDRALQLAEAAVDEATATGHRFSQVVGLAYQAMLMQLLGRVEECDELATRVVDDCNRYQFTYYGEWGEMLKGWARGGEKGADLIAKGLARHRAMGAGLRRSYWLCLQAETTDDPAERRGLLDEALADVERSGERWWLPELLRVRAGDLHGADRDAMLGTALDTARRQHSGEMERRIRSSTANRSRVVGPEG